MTSSKSQTIQDYRDKKAVSEVLGRALRNQKMKEDSTFEALGIRRID